MQVSEESNIQLVNMPEEIRLAESIWCEIGRKADIGTANENFSLQTGKHAEKKNTSGSGDKRKRDDAPTTAAVRSVDDTLPHLSSDEEEPNVVDSTVDPTDVDAANVDATTVNAAPKKRTATTLTASTAKQSHSRAASDDFLEAFQLSMLQEQKTREQDRLDRQQAREQDQQAREEAREQDRQAREQDRLDRQQDRLDRREEQKEMLATLAAMAGGFADRFAKKK